MGTSEMKAAYPPEGASTAISRNTRHRARRRGSHPQSSCTSLGALDRRAGRDTRLSRGTPPRLLASFNHYPLADVCRLVWVELLADGSHFGLDLTYRYQHGALGIAHAIGLARDFVGDDSFCCVLGDNVLRGPS